MHSAPGPVSWKVSLEPCRSSSYFHGCHFLQDIFLKWLIMKFGYYSKSILDFSSPNNSYLIYVLLLGTSVNGHCIVFWMLQVHGVNGKTCIFWIWSSYRWRNGPEYWIRDCRVCVTLVNIVGSIRQSGLSVIFEKGTDVQSAAGDSSYYGMLNELFFY